jgi:hypothetical protein
LEVPFRNSAVAAHYGLIVFKGIQREGSHVAKSYEQVPYDRIARIEQRPGRGRAPRRRKAS